MQISVDESQDEFIQMQASVDKSLDDSRQL